MRSIELFAGAGGLALGIDQAGFRSEIIVERDRATCITLRENQQRGLQPLTEWQIFDRDVQQFCYSTIQGTIDLVSGGPPCQPFSLGGKHAAYNDHRDMFSEAVRAVRELQPKAFLFENVKGLSRETFATYFGYIQLQLRHPELIKRPNEDWLNHLVRLDQHHTAGIEPGLGYCVMYRLVNAADYGVPQKRERIFIVGFRNDVQQRWNFPDPTHSQEALWWSQWASNEYWDRHAVPSNQRPCIKPNVASRLVRLHQAPLTGRLPWLTVRDAFGDLPDPENQTLAKKMINHEFRAGARVYKGHTGSLLDEPAKALKAGDHGVPGGENMLVLADGRVRYFTIRESARLQGFPDAYVFPGSWTESMRQLGNAVPVLLGYKVAASIAATLERSPKT